MAGAEVGFSVTVGALVARWPAAGGAMSLISVECATGIGGGWARVELGPPQGRAPKAGDPLRVELDGGDGARKVFTGEVDHVGSTPTAWSLRAHDGLARLSRLDLERAWADTTADAVLKDLLSAAGLRAGEVASGPSLRRFVALKGPRGLRLVEGLLARMGADLFVDGEGRVQVVQPPTGPAAQVLTWGVDLLDASVARVPPPLPGIEVRGEGAADAQGAARGHWLPRDVRALVGRADIDATGKLGAGAEGQPGFTVVDGALGTAQACKDVARAWASREAARPFTGELRLLGRPTMAPNQRLQVRKLPDDHALGAVLDGATLRARRVIHRFDAAGGYTTRVEL